MLDMTRITTKIILTHKINKISKRNEKFVEEILQDTNQHLTEGMLSIPRHLYCCRNVIQ